MTSFDSLNLSPALLSNLKRLNYKEATPVQEKAIPLVLKGRDLMASAQTGTGKTAGFVLPILERMSTTRTSGPTSVRALILVPTRELAEQVLQAVQSYSDGLPLKSYAVYGGVALNPQITAVKEGVDILVATPGRLLDLYRQNVLEFPDLKYLVLDEADRMLDLGFADELDDLFCAFPKRRQTLLFSATFSPRVKELAKELLRDPATIEIAAPNTTADTVTQLVIPVDKKRKTELLQHLIKNHGDKQALIFVKMRKQVDELESLFNNGGASVAGLHGEKSQAMRNAAMQSFKDKEIQLLIATDVAARGLDVDDLPLVINVDLPFNAEDYVHRIGRSGRKGKSGSAISLVTADEVNQLAAIEALTGKLIKRRAEAGFEPSHKLPETQAGGIVVTKNGAINPATDKQPGKRSGSRPGKSGRAGGPRMFDHSDDARSGRNKDRRKRKK
ncbi:MAG: DEAD/DEAH box helicase [Thalassolituus sp.]